MASQAKKQIAIWSGILSIILISCSALYIGLTHKKAVVESSSAKIDGFMLPQAKSISDFKLDDNLGRVFTQDNLKGQWTLVFFGFTNCGMVCPTTMSALNEMYEILEKQKFPQLPNVVMVSVDPDRDTVERMDEYVKAFNPHFLGARAEMPQIETLEKELHLVAVKMQAEGQSKNQYTINHSAEIMVFNPQGKLQAFLSYPHKPEQMVKDYKYILNSQG